MSFSDPTPKLGDSDNNLLFKIAQLLDGGGSGGAITQAEGDARYILKTGDTATGAINVTMAVAIAADDPAIDISQNWNNAGVTFHALQISVTNTAAAAASALIEGLVDGISRFNVRKNSTVTLHRQEADTSASTLMQSKRGTTGDATAAISSGSGLGAIDCSAWDGTSQATVANLRTFALEAFTNTAHGCQFTFGVPAIGATTILTRLSVAATGVNAQNGAAYLLNGVALLNPASTYAAGTVYTLTATSAGVDFGTTDPILTITAAGTYRLRGRVKVALNGATFAANRTLTVKLRRTNNTPGDVANSSTTWIVPIVTTLTNTLAVIELPEVSYTTANSDDTIQIFADISVLPTAGTISIDEACITSIRTS